MKRLLHHPHFGIILILLIALGLRLPNLTDSFWLDEAAQALESSRPLTQQFDVIPDFQPPLLHLLLHFGMYLDDSEWWLRTIGALVPGLVTIYATYRIGLLVSPNKRLTNPLDQVKYLFAPTLLAVSSFHIFYSQELRPYALPAMWATVSWLLLLRLQQMSRAEKSQPKLSTWAAYTGVSVAGIYSSYLYPFVLLGQLGWWLWSDPRRWRSMITSLVVTGLGFVPWLPIFLQQLAAGGEVRLRLPGWAEVVSIPQLKSIPLVFGKFTFGVVNISLEPFFLVSAGVLVVGSAWLGYAWLTSNKQLNLTAELLKLSRWYIVWWLVVPLLLAWIVSFWIPVVRPKRFLFAMPAFFLVIQAWVWWGAHHKTKRTQLVAASFGVTLLAIQLISTSLYLTQPQLQRENWRSLYQEITTRYPDQAIAVYPYIAPYSPWVWYDRQLNPGTQYPTLSTQTLHISEVASVRDWLEPATEYRYIITFDYLRDLTDPNNQLLQEVEAFGYETIDIIDYPNIGFVRVYAKPGSTLSLELESVR